MDGCKNGVRVLSTTDGTTSGVDVSNSISAGGGPVALLEAKDIVGLSGPGADV